MTLVIGVDGGGTSAKGVILDGNGNEVARGASSGAVVTLQDPDSAATAVASAVRSAAMAGGVQLPVSVLWAGLAGAGSQTARQVMEDKLSGRGLADVVRVGTDVEAAFYDAFRSGPGVLLIAGTGSIAWGRNEEGQIHRAGGWGEDLGDEGSGFAIGRDALRALLRFEDGRGGPTSLKGPLLDYLGLDESRDLISWISSATKGQVSALAPLVVREASGGDKVAKGILSLAVAELQTHVDGILEQLSPWDEDPVLALHGGLVGSGGPLREPVIRSLITLRLKLFEGEVDSPRGAASLALRTAVST